MEKWMPLITATIALFGVTLGASIQHFFALRVEGRKSLLEVRTNAYVDFLKGQTARWRAQKQHNQQGEDEANSTIDDARIRIAVYGTKRTIEAMVDHFRRYSGYAPCEGLREKWTSDAAIYQSMRADLYRDDTSQKLDYHALVPIAFNCELPKERSR